MEELFSQKCFLFFGLWFLDFSNHNIVNISVFPAHTKLLGVL